MKRRDFLKNSLLAGGVPFFLGGLPMQVMGRNHLLSSLLGTETDRVLVLIQLNGGNDGLNTLIPLDQYANLAPVRSNVLIPSNKVLPITTDTGFHPAMGGLKNMYQDGKLGMVQGVGYPDPNFSHFRSTDIWTTASPADEVWETGWVGRYLNDLHPNYPDGYPSNDHPDPLAVTIGALVSNTCQGPVMNFSMAISDPDNFEQLLTGVTAPAPNTPYGVELTFLRKSQQQTNAYLASVKSAADRSTTKSSLYPTEGENSLADQLKIVARLIAGGLQTPFYVVSLGGFDTHANQVEFNDTTAGLHADLMGKVSEAVVAFQDDLKQHQVEDRVVGMTFSEFGRRIVSNGSFGTDHGTSAPLFLFGTQVNPAILGQNPIIPQGATPQDNLPMQYDFRDVYASVLEDWFSVDSEKLRQWFHAGYQHVPVLRAAAPNSVEAEMAVDWELGQNYPNPANGSTRIPLSLTNAGTVRLTLFNHEGRLIRTAFERHLTPGKHEIDLDTHELAAGRYYYRVQRGAQQQTKVLLVR